MAERPRPSGIRAVFDRALELEREGRHIVHLEIGRPHLGSPPVAVRAAVAALEAGTVHYTANRGLPELRGGHRRSHRPGRRRDRGHRGRQRGGGGGRAGRSSSQEMRRSCSIRRGHTTMDTCVWPAACPSTCACRAQDGFQPDPERVRSAVTPRTRLLVVSSPSNPTGAVIEPENVAALAALCRERDLLVLSDEIYASFVYDGAQHRSIASEPGMTERTVIADSCSKTWSMTGWRVGWAIAPPPLAGRDQRRPSASERVRAGIRSGRRGGRAARRRRPHRRDGPRVRRAPPRRCWPASASLDTCASAPPTGAFYAFPRLQIPGVTGEQAAIRLLEDAGVALVPGGVFGEGFDDSHPDLIRGLGALSCPRACRGCASSPRVRLSAAPSA